MLHRRKDDVYDTLVAALAPHLAPLGFRPVKTNFIFRRDKSDRWQSVFFNFGTYPGFTAINCVAYVSFATVENLVARIDGRKPPRNGRNRTVSITRRLGRWNTQVLDCSDVASELIASILGAGEDFFTAMSTVDELWLWLDDRLRNGPYIDGHQGVRLLCALYLRRDRDAFLAAFPALQVKQAHSQQCEGVEPAYRFLESHWDDNFEGSAP